MPGPVDPARMLAAELVEGALNGVSGVVRPDWDVKDGSNRMNGAESLVRTLVGGGVDVCFSNPGTSEMHFVAALDRVEGMRCVLALFEGVATGAADGYARMTETPAATCCISAPASPTASPTCTTP